MFFPLCSPAYNLLAMSLPTYPVAPQLQFLGGKKNSHMTPKVYIETSIPSYLTARLSGDLRVAANQSTTIEWWETHCPEFDLFISELVVSEASLGNPEAAQKRLEALLDLPPLSVTESVKSLAETLVSEGPFRPMLRWMPII